MFSWLFSLFILAYFLVFPSSLRCHGSHFSPTSKGFASHSECRGVKTKPDASSPVPVPGQSLPCRLCCSTAASGRDLGAAVPGEGQGGRLGQGLLCRRGGAVPSAQAREGKRRGGLESPSSLLLQQGLGLGGSFPSRGLVSYLQVLSLPPFQPLAHLSALTGQLSSLVLSGCKGDYSNM